MMRGSYSIKQVLPALVPELHKEQINELIKDLVENNETNPGD